PNHLLSCNQFLKQQSLPPTSFSYRSLSSTSRPMLQYHTLLSTLSYPHDSITNPYARSASTQNTFPHWKSQRKQTFHLIQTFKYSVSRPLSFHPSTYSSCTSTAPSVQISLHSSGFFLLTSSPYTRGPLLQETSTPTTHGGTPHVLPGMQIL